MLSVFDYNQITFVFSSSSTRVMSSLNLSSECCALDYIYIARIFYIICTLIYADEKKSLMRVLALSWKSLYIIFDRSRVSSLMLLSPYSIGSVYICAQLKNT